MTKEVQIAPQSEVHLECSLSKLSDQYQSCTGLFVHSDRIKEKCNNAITWSLSKFADNVKAFVSTIYLPDTQTTLNNQTEIAVFAFLKEIQAGKGLKLILS